MREVFILICLSVAAVAFVGCTKSSTSSPSENLISPPTQSPFPQPDSDGSESSSKNPESEFVDLKISLNTNSSYTLSSEDVALLDEGNIISESEKIEIEQWINK